MALPSPRDRLAAFLAEVDDPGARVVRGARFATLGLITGGLTAIPVLALLDGASPWQYVLAFGVLGLGLVCLRTDWSDKGPHLLYAVAITATLIIALATALVTPAFAINYMFITLAVAVTASYRFVLGMVGAITIALLAPALTGPYAGQDMLALPIVGGPALLVVSGVAFQLTRMLERSRQVYRHLSRHDDLTGVGNYRSLLEKLEEEISRHSRHRESLSVMLLDLDQFKAINDQRGHLFGDQVLAEVAAAIVDSVRIEDSVFRQGGDEFSIIAPHTQPEELQVVIERIKENVADCGDANSVMTISAGVATFPDDEKNPMELLAVADERLMSAKRDRGAGSTERLTSQLDAGSS